MKNLFFAFVVLAMTACQTPNNLVMDQNGKIVAGTDTRSFATMNAEGDIRSAYNGVAPNVTMMDDKGVWDANPGPSSILTFDLKSNRVLSKSPKDTIIRGVKVTPNPAPGQPSFEADSIETNISSPLDRYTIMFKDGVDATQGMSKAEAQARVDALVAGGQITAQIAEAVMKIAFPN